MFVRTKSHTGSKFSKIPFGAVVHLMDCSCATIFVDKKRKLTATLPPPISGISRSTSFKILGVTITSSLSVADHIHTIVTSCSQTLHALKSFVLKAYLLKGSSSFSVELSLLNCCTLPVLGGDLLPPMINSV